MRKKVLGRRIDAKCGYLLKVDIKQSKVVSAVFCPLRWPEGSWWEHDAEDAPV